MSRLSQFFKPVEAVVPNAELPNVVEVLDFGYAIHVADDPVTTGTKAREIAILQIERLKNIKVEPRSVQEAYLHTATGLALAFGRALARRKQAWKEDREAALQNLIKKESRLYESRKSTSGLALAWKLLGPVILGIAGVLVGQIVSLVVPDEIAQQTGKKLPSILMGLVFVFVGRAYTFWITDKKRQRLESEYRERCYQADQSYLLGKQQEYNFFFARCCEAWKEYTGQDYPKGASYEMVMEGDIATRRMFEQRIRSHNQSALLVLRRAVRIVRRKKKKKEIVPA